MQSDRRVMQSDRSAMNPRRSLKGASCRKHATRRAAVRDVNPRGADERVSLIRSENTSPCACVHTQNKGTFVFSEHERETQTRKRNTRGYIARGWVRVYICKLSRIKGGAVLLSRNYTGDPSIFSRFQYVLLSYYRSMCTRNF